MFVKLCSINRDSTLLSGELLEFQAFSSQIDVDANLKGNYSIIKDLIHRFGDGRGWFSFQICSRLK
jgi:hypothetical protein